MRPHLRKGDNPHDPTFEKNALKIMPLADVFFPNSFTALLEAGTGTSNSHSRNYLLGLDGDVFLARVTPSLSYILGLHRYDAFLF
ncbi:hypothetical protein E2C01_077858 [Portunus trituberculatus]|uniref:Uncharacterized protein n=1 Tax=Portunus trituberculatus TaxID=210409 RepID=A0A5B7IH25_PORTR|nr:hypothetical protein [Portunus trituberculatus]